jgi:hypothetical protein
MHKQIVTSDGRAHCFDTCKCAATNDILAVTVLSDVPAEKVVLAYMAIRFESH